MTPQLQQAIKLLQLSNLELISFVETELERNPLLERADADEPNADGERFLRRGPSRKSSRTKTAPRVMAKPRPATTGSGSILSPVTA